MSNSTDKINARNLENLHVVNSIVETIPGFNPASELISKTALLALERDFAILLETLHEKITVESNATVAQTEAFEPVGRMASRIASAAKAHGVSAEASLRLDRTVKLIRGHVRRAEAAPEMATAPAGIEPASPGPPVPAVNGNGGRAKAHGSLASKLSNLDVLHEQVLSMPNYRPNEEELTSERVGGWIVGLRRIRNTKLEARADSDNTRRERDDFLVGPGGLAVRMRMLKMYVNSILDPDDDRSRRIRGLRFVFRVK